MRALVATGDESLVSLGEVPDPQPGSAEILVDVDAFSLNRGELRRLRSAPRGWRPGWDFVGTVARDPGTDGGLTVGQRVFGLAAEGSWAERLTISRNRIAIVPDKLDPIIAATLPVAGVTASRMLSSVRPLRSRRVLVTGGAGGVGRIAVQLAQRQGADVTAVVGRLGRGSDLRDLGASSVIVGIDKAAGPYDVILESVGGSSLARCLELLDRGGVLISFGISSGERAKIDVAAFYPRQATMRGYFLLDDVVDRPPASDLEKLARDVIRGNLRIDIPLVLPWTDVRVALRALSDRSLEGKAVVVVERNADHLTN